MSIFGKVVAGASREAIQHLQYVEEWKDYYAGEAPYLEYLEKNIDGRTRKRKRNFLNPAKIICQEMASLVFSETPRVEGSKLLEKVLRENDFWQNLSDGFEKQCAMGAQAIKVYVKDNELYLDFIPADQFVPLSWDNRRVTEGAFIDYRVIRGKQYARVEYHEKYYPPLRDETGEVITDPDTGKVLYSNESVGYIIWSELYRLDTGDIQKVEIGDLLPSFMFPTIIETELPPFVYIKNPIANNTGSMTPLGVSIYANALDTLKSIDIAFDGMAEAPELCRPRILLSKELVRETVNTETGEKVKYFDPRDRVFQSAPFGDPDQQIPIKDLTIPLDHEPIRRQIQTELDLLSMQVGLSAGTISFDSYGGIKTATEVVSENSKTYRTREKYVGRLIVSLKDLFDVIQEIGAAYGIGLKEEYTITFPDSVIEDKNATAAYWTGLAGAGLVPAYYALMQIEGITEEEAKRLTGEAGAMTLPVIDA